MYLHNLALYIVYKHVLSKSIYGKWQVESVLEKQLFRRVQWSCSQQDFMPLAMPRETKLYFATAST